MAAAPNAVGGCGGSQSVRAPSIEACLHRVTQPVRRCVRRGNVFDHVALSRHRRRAGIQSDTDAGAQIVELLPQDTTTTAKGPSLRSSARANRLREPITLLKGVGNARARRFGSKRCLSPLSGARRSKTRYSQPQKLTVRESGAGPGNGIPPDEI